MFHIILICVYFTHIEEEYHKMGNMENRKKRDFAILFLPLFIFYSFCLPPIVRSSITADLPVTLYARLNFWKIIENRIKCICMG